MPLEASAHVFVDLSNLWYGARAAAERIKEPVYAVRLMAEPLARVLAGGRPVGSAVIVANDDVPAVVTDHFARIGTVIRRESGKNTGGEQANDETLQVRMYEALFAHKPAVMVLATGDANGWRQRTGFLPALDAARRLGWAVEAVAWGETANGELRSWVTRVGGAFVDLDPFYYSVTFLEDERRVQPVLLRARPFARVEPHEAVDLPASLLRA
ncbi:MAG: NYN domain-containing protein [Chloroflexota bacterium]